MDIDKNEDNENKISEKKDINENEYNEKDIAEILEKEYFRENEAK